MIAIDSDTHKVGAASNPTLRDFARDWVNTRATFLQISFMYRP